MKKTFLLALSLCSMLLGGAAVVVTPEKAEIVVPKNASATVRFAAMELQDHLKMVTEKKIPIVSRKSQEK